MSLVHLQGEHLSDPNKIPWSHSSPKMASLANIANRVLNDLDAINGSRFNTDSEVT
jgi:hypothetical protein